MEKTIFSIKLIIVAVDALFELYLAIVCSVCINTKQIVHDIVYVIIIINLFNQQKVWAVKYVKTHKKQVINTKYIYIYIKNKICQ